MVVNHTLQVIYDQINQIKNDIKRGRLNTFFIHTHEGQVLGYYAIKSTLIWVFENTQHQPGYHMSMYQVLY